MVVTLPDLKLSSHFGPRDFLTNSLGLTEPIDNIRTSKGYPQDEVPFLYIARIIREITVSFILEPYEVRKDSSDLACCRRLRLFEDIVERFGIGFSWSFQTCR